MFVLQIPEAMQKMHDRKNVGKIVLDPSMEPKPKPATPAKGKAKSIDKEDKKKSEDESNDSPPPSASKWNVQCLLGTQAWGLKPACWIRPKDLVSWPYGMELVVEDGIE